MLEAGLGAYFSTGKYDAGRCDLRSFAENKVASGIRIFRDSPGGSGGCNIFSGAKVYYYCQKFHTCALDFFSKLRSFPAVY